MTGAKVLAGGDRPSRKGFFYLPTVLKNVAPGMTAFEQEIFGPVASLIVAKNDDEAVELANKTAYGCGARREARSKNRSRFRLHQWNGKIGSPASVRGDQEIRLRARACRPGTA